MAHTPPWAIFLANAGAVIIRGGGQEREARRGAGRPGVARKPPGRAREVSSYLFLGAEAPSNVLV